MLASPNHNCHCLDNFVSNIDMLKIGNPDDELNKINALNNRIEVLKNKIAALENENKIDIVNGNGNRSDVTDISTSSSPINSSGYYGLSTSPIQSSLSST
eukprot:UN04005